MALNTYVVKYILFSSMDLQFNIYLTLVMDKPELVGNKSCLLHDLFVFFKIISYGYT